VLAEAHAFDLALPATGELRGWPAFNAAARPAAVRERRAMELPIPVAEPRLGNVAFAPNE